MLYLITNRKLIHEIPFEQVIEEAVRGGVDAIIVREKDLCYNELLELAVKLKGIIAQYGTKLIINGSTETALAVAEKINAWGFHTSFSEFMEKKPVFDGSVGVSVHSVEEAAAAEQGGAGYVLAGHVFKTECKKGLEPKGVEMLREMKKLVHIQVIAIGGIDIHNLHIALESGIDGVAVMSGIMSADMPYIASKQLKEQLVLLKRIRSFAVKHNKYVR